MGILEERDLKRIKKQFTRLDFKVENIEEKLKNIIDEALKNNESKLGKNGGKTLSEHISETNEAFDMARELKEQGAFDLAGEELKGAIEETVEGFDEEKEKEDLKKLGILENPEITESDIAAEILRILEEVIEERKKKLQKEIDRNNEILPKVQERENLKSKREQVNNLCQKTKDLKGSQGKKLNQNAQGILKDYNEQIKKLQRETMRNGKELSEEGLNEENKKLEEEINRLNSMMETLKNQYMKTDMTKERIVFNKFKKVIVSKSSDLKADMDESEIIEVIQKLKKDPEFKEAIDNIGDEMDKFDEEMQKNLEEMLKNEIVTIKNRSFFKEDSSPKLMDIMNLIFTANVRKKYIKENQKEKPSEEECEKYKKEFTEGYKKGMKAINPDMEVSELRTQEEYEDEVEDILSEAKKIESNSVGKSGKIKEIVKRMNKLYNGLFTVMDSVSTNKIRMAYEKVKIVLSSQKADVRSVKDLPGTLLKEKRASFVPKAETFPIDFTGEEYAEVPETGRNGQEEGQEGQEGQEPAE